ncbi:hypothetical protein WJX72_009430 [[Myrmecia] bisecta]|uniref:Uncharacterized protein n=1 Tax=[Myrmecia] bisecta TaxID=41462 RepID=A0AAW1QS39_9CHLO
MAFSLSENNVLVPALVGLAVVVATVLVFYIATRKKTRGTGGSKFVRDDDGNTVRRSTRSRKSVSRWSPDDLASPTGMSSPVVKPSTPAAEKPTTPAAVKTPAAPKSVKKVVSAIKAEVEEVKEVLSSPSPVKRGPGRPPKTPKAETPASPRGAPSPPVTRRAAKTPKK